MNHPPEQRQLDLWQAELDALPWGGQSPRALTSAAKRFIFKAQAGKDERFFSDPMQRGLFDEEPKAPWLYQGAPLLLPLREVK